MDYHNLVKPIEFKMVVLTWLRNIGLGTAYVWSWHVLIVALRLSCFIVLIF